MDNKDIIEQIIEFRAEAEDGNGDIFERMSRCERFRIGDQWDSDTLERYKSKRKHALTINLIHPIVNQLTGVQIQNPRDIRVLNTKGSTKTRAKILTALAKDTMDNSMSQRHRTTCFDDGITNGRGWIGCDFDYSKDPANGDLVIKNYDSFKVLPDPNATTQDLNDPKGGAKYIIVDEWEDKQKVEIQYPGRKNDLESADYYSHRTKGRFSHILNYMFGRSSPGSTLDDYRDHEKNLSYSERTSRAKNNYRVSTIWWKKWKRVIAVSRTDDPLDIRIFYKTKDIKNAERLASMEQEDFKVIDKDPEGKPLTMGILNRTKVVGDILLETKEDPLNGVHLFPIVKYSPYYIHGYEFGVVQNQIGRQEQYNWSRSMFLNLIKNLANTGWITGKTNSVKKDWLKNHGSEDGVAIDKSDYGDYLEKIEPNEIPTSFELMSQNCKEEMAESSGVRQESPQTDKDRVATTIKLKQASSLTNSAILFSNFDYTIELLGNLVIELIRSTKVYSTEEMLAIVDKNDLIDPELLKMARQRAIDDYAPELRTIRVEGPEDIPLIEKTVSMVEDIAQFYAISDLIEEMENISIGRYGIKVTMSPMAETFKIAKSMETLELNEMLLKSQHEPLSRKQLIEAVDPINKEEILAEETAAVR